MSAGGLSAELKALELVQVLSKGRISMVVAVAPTHDMRSVRLMMDGGLRGVRLRQLVRVGVGISARPRDNRM
jgi:hypothetical protein